MLREASESGSHSASVAFCWAAVIEMSALTRVGVEPRHRSPQAQAAVRMLLSDACMRLKGPVLLAWVCGLSGCAGRSLSDGDTAPCEGDPAGAGGRHDPIVVPVGAGGARPGRGGANVGAAGATAGSSFGSAPSGPAVRHCEGSCSGCDLQPGICYVECNGDGSCTQTDLVCPEGYPCEISCFGDNACIQADAWCPDGYPCSLECNGRLSCTQLRYHCGGSGCSFSCRGSHACTQVHRD